MSFELNILILCLETDGFSLITKRLLWKETATRRGECFLLLGAVRWPKQGSQKAFSWFLRSVPIPGTKQVFAFSPVDTQALRTCFHKVNCPLRSLLGTFFWLLTLKCMQAFICGVCGGICHLPPPILKGGWPRPGIELENPVASSRARLKICSCGLIDLLMP